MRATAAIRTTMIATLALAAGPVRGQANDPNNAATWYSRAMEQYAQFRESSPEQFELLLNFDPDAPITPELRAALQRVQPILEQVRQGSLQEFADRQLDYSQGIELMLPHLSEMRHLARAMRADVAVRLHDGDHAAAADRLADMYRMSGHFSSDRIIISCLVGQAVFHLADVTVQQAMDRGAFGSAESATLLEAINRLNTTDPFDYLEAVAAEQDIFVADYRDRMNDPVRRHEAMSMMSGFGDDDLEMAMMLMSEQQIQADIDNYDKVMARMVEIFANADREEAKADLEALHEEIKSGQHGVLVQLMMPAFSKIFENREKAEAMLAERAASLRKLAAGEAQPIEFANAALWYLPAIARMEEAEPAQLEALRAVAAAPFEPLDEAAKQALLAKPLQDAIAMFRDGSQSRRCDFSKERQEQIMPAIVPRYAPGMHDALRLLRADAMRLLRENDPAGAVDRLVIALRACAHLGSDPQLASALIAHRNFSEIIKVIEYAMGNRMLDETGRAALLDAVERMSRKDPFGYIGAVIESRKALTNQILRKLPTDGPHAEQLQAQVKTVELFNGDQILHVLAAMDTLIRAGQPTDAAKPAEAAANDGDAPAKPHRADPMTRLSDIFNLQMLQLARSQAAHIAAMMAHDDWDFFSNGPATIFAVGGYVNNMSRSRDDLRRAYSLLRPPREQTASQDEAP